MKSFFARFLGRHGALGPDLDGDFLPHRTLRSFDGYAIAPYDHKGLVAFLHAEKLTDLTPDEIRVFLLLRENPEPQGYAESYIADHLGMPLLLVRSCLGRLRWMGYAEQSNRIPLLDSNPEAPGWVVDGSNMWADADMLFWEFAPL